ncbi:hypothetical protein ACFVQ0_00295 [Streptomyces sp. NPDC057900]|uniref:hypothetical protein n=1 Tax=Streptomyces sp. NPDC057900 TaxID=3346274 RepID=UPI0036E90ADF
MSPTLGSCYDGGECTVLPPTEVLTGLFVLSLVSGLVAALNPLPRTRRSPGVRGVALGVQWGAQLLLAVLLATAGTS